MKILTSVVVLLLFTGCLQPAIAPSTRFAEVDHLLDTYQERHAFPGGVLAVGNQTGLLHLHPFGHLSYDADSRPVTADTLYDLASLTKVVATTTMAMILVDEKRLDIDKPVHDYLPAFQGPGKEEVTVRHLLTHSSGLEATVHLFQEIRGKAAYAERIAALDLTYSPGSKSVYSDLGIILLGELLEKAARRPLDVFVRERVFLPLGMKHTGFRPPRPLWPRIAPTEYDPWRGRMIQGEVHDENAFAMGGVAPHAGLFSTAGDLALFAHMLLNGGGPHRLQTDPGAVHEEGSTRRGRTTSSERSARPWPTRWSGRSMPPLHCRPCSRPG